MTFTCLPYETQPEEGGDFLQISHTLLCTKSVYMYKLLTVIYFQLQVNNPGQITFDRYQILIL